MAKLTQAQFTKKLAEMCDVPAKAAKTMVTAYADLAVKETKTNGVCVLPGIGRLVKLTARLAWAAIRPPAKPSRSRPRKS